MIGLATPVGSAQYVLWLAGAIAAVLILTKGFGAMFARIGQPGSFGEIMAGIILGGSVLGLLDPHDPVIHALSQAGIIVLLFSAGLHTRLGSLMHPGNGAGAVAGVGVAVPFALGVGATYLLGATWIESLVAGAAMGASSIFVSTRTLGSLGLLDSEEGRVIQGAAVIDDVISLAIVAVVMALVTSTNSAAEVVVRSLLVPTAFTAGLVIDVKGLNGKVERITSRLYWLIAPFFFAVTGALIDLRTLAGSHTLALIGALVALGMVGKVAAGWGPRRFSGNRLLVGVAMMPRGAVGLIFANLGFAAGAIDAALFAAIVVMVFVTALVTPPMLRMIAASRSAANVPA